MYPVKSSNNKRKLITVIYRKKLPRVNKYVLLYYLKLWYKIMKVSKKYITSFSCFTKQLDVCFYNDLGETKIFFSVNYRLYQLKAKTKYNTYYIIKM